MKDLQLERQVLTSSGRKWASAAPPIRMRGSVGHCWSEDGRCMAV